MKPTIPEIIPLLKEFMDKEENSNGGNYHIVLCDPNFEDSHVRSCLDDAKKKGDELEIRIGEMLMKMSKTQRKKIYNKTYVYFGAKWIGRKDKELKTIKEK